MMEVMIELVLKFHFIKVELIHQMKLLYKILFYRIMQMINLALLDLECVTLTLTLDNG